MLDVVHFVLFFSSYIDVEVPEPEVEPTPHTEPESESTDNEVDSNGELGNEYIANGIALWEV